MKKTLKIVTVIVLLGVSYFFYALYPKFDIVAGFSSKSIASHYFLAGRSQEFTEKTDNNVNSMELATTVIDKASKTVSSSVFGLKNRKAQYFNGLGTILIPQHKEGEKIKRAIPNRIKKQNNSPYPYGNSSQKDTIFYNINYKELNFTLEKAFTESTELKKNRAVLVIYKNHIVAERYQKGFDKNAMFLGWSMAKSITSTVVGILEKQGKVNLGQNNLFTEWKNDDRKNITLANLVNMNSGLEWEEDYTKICDVTEMLFIDANMTQKQKNKQFVGKPNETWNYSSGTSNLLCGFIRNQFTNQQDYLDFWYKELIDKIGMNSMLIETDYSGHYVGSSYAWATARDWGKFGLLYLHNGNWNGEQILNKSWVDFTKKPTNTSNGKYGGHFWLNSSSYYPSAPKDMFSCNGYQGQRVFIIPSKELVIVRFGLSEDENLIDDLLKDILLNFK